MQAGKGLQDARFAGAIGAQNGDQLARVDHQVDAFDHWRRAIVDAQVAHVQHGIARACPGLRARLGLVLGATQVRGNHPWVSAHLFRCAPGDRFAGVEHQ
ncbi:hypothetical protein D3C79_856710 [compost metagenome]